jgi:hypothetical protein
MKFIGAFVTKFPIKKSPNDQNPEIMDQKIKIQL